MWKNVKKYSKLCNEVGTHGWISQVARGLQAARRCTGVKHAEKLNRHTSCSTTGKRVQSGHSVISRLGLATQSSCEAKSPVHSVIEKLTLRIHFSLQYKYLLYPQNVENFQREFWERNPSKTRLTRPQYLHSDSSNSSTLTLSIVRSLRGSLAKTFSPYPYLWDGFLAFWEVVRKGLIYIGWCYGL